MIALLGVVLMGSITGVVVDQPGGGKATRRWTRIHVALVWLLTALTAMHVFTVYYF
jgi:cytochrome b561